MNSKEKPELIRIAEAISDGIPVDWQSQDPAPPADEPVVRQLRDLERLAAAHREGGSAPGGLRPRDAAKDAAPEIRPGANPAGKAEPLLQTWGPLRILEKLGGGAFGEVFRAYDPSLRREVALKLLHSGEHASSSEDRYLNEARRIARVRHPNVLVVYGADRHDGRVGLWTDLVRGETLEEVLARQGPFGAYEAAVIGMELCRALAALHAAGLVHRDLKTTNVMREKGGRVVLMDFGTASEGASAPDRDEARQGTPVTMAPEQLRGEPVGPPADIYGLGVLLFRLVTGRYPIEASSLADLYDRHERGASHHALDLRPDLTPEFVRVVERALAPRPEQRFSSAGEMVSALAATLRGASKSHEIQRGPMARGRRAALWPWAAAALAVAILILLALWRQLPLFRSGGLAHQRALQAAPVPGARSQEAPASTPMARLHRLREGRDEPLAPNDGLTLGDALSLEYEGPQPMHVYVFDRDEKGSVFVLFPIAGLDLANPLPAHARLRLPGTRQGQPFDWRVSSRGGREEFVVLASPTPLETLEQGMTSFPRARVGGEADAAPPGDGAPRGLRGVGIITPESPAGDSNSRILSQAIRELEHARPDVWVWKLMLQGPEP